MVVAMEMNEGRWRCTWWHKDGDFRSHDFHPDALEVAEKKDDAANPPLRRSRSNYLDR